jgi:DNA-binding response OmpR family regulator
MPRILLVDDERDITIILKKGLNINGYEVDVFNDPREALSKFKPDYYFGVLSDVRMPAMSGFELCRKLVEIDSKLRVAFMSAYEIYEDQARKTFPSLKTDCFIKKPVSIDYLVKRLESCMQHAAAA